MLNKFILKSAPLAVRLPVSPSLFFCFSILYLKPTTPNDISAHTFSMMNTATPGFKPRCISCMVVSVRFNASSLPRVKVLLPLL